jgi:hypothetical protein
MFSYFGFMIIVNNKYYIVVLDGITIILFYLRNM